MKIKFNDGIFYVIGLVSCIISIVIPLASVTLIATALSSLFIGLFVRRKVEKQRWDDQVAFMNYVAGTEQ